MIELSKKKFRKVNNTLVSTPGDQIIMVNSIYSPESYEAELGDDLPYTTGQIWAACGVLVVVMLAIVFGGAWLGVQ